MLQAVRVWAVELGEGVGPAEREGQLSLGDDALRFEPSKGGQAMLVLPFASMTKVRRLRGSPVLMVASSLGGREVRIAFYFVQPPPLAVLTQDLSRTRPSLPALRNPKRKARRDNVGYLGLMNREKKDVLVAWEHAVRAAAAAARGP